MKLKHLKEKRYYSNPDLSIRAITGDSNTDRYIEGYAALFNVESRLIAEYRDGKLIEFIEVIESGAFDEVLADPELNCIHTIDHDRSKMVARTTSGTLKLMVDDRGLKYRFAVPNTTLGNDLFEMISRGDYYESSFVFYIDSKADGNEVWEKGEDNILRRTIKKVSGIYDTSTVVDGAYANTNVTVSRNLSDLIEPVEPVKTEVSNTVNDLNQIELDILINENE